MAAAIASGLALAAFAYLRYLPLALPLLVIAGGGVILAAASANTILQTIVEDRLRGRVAGFYMLSFLGVAPIGSLAAGALASSMGVPAVFLVNGLVAVLGGLLFLRGLPRLHGAVEPVYARLALGPAPSDSRTSDA